MEWGLEIGPTDVERLARDATWCCGDRVRRFALGFNGPAWNVEHGADFLAWRDALNRAPGA